MENIEYVKCQECSHEFEVVTQTDGLVHADGMDPSDSDGDSLIFHISHFGSGRECEATLIVPKEQ